MNDHHLPQTSLDRLHALVCGASAGIGRAVALTLAARGARVTALARSGEALEALVDELRLGGADDPAYVVADHDDRAGLGAIVDGVLADRGAVQVLINNSGGPPAGPLLEAGEADFLLALGRHLLAGHLLVRATLPGMREAGYGRIVNIVSTSVREPIPGLGVSNTTRGAVASWAKSLADELPPGVTINNVLPGFTDTDRLHSLAEVLAERSGGSPADVQAGWLATIPEGRLADPLETAALVAFLVSPAAGYLRGQSIAIDGGRMRSI
jgi:3-oxoacyl-[acyl-carrier protein] reductase